MLKGTMAQQIYRFWTSGAPLSAFARWASVMLLEGPALVSVDSRFYTSFFLTLWGWGWKSEILLGPSQWEAAYVSRHWWTTETDENDLLGWNNTVSQVRSFKQPTILCGASLLSDHTSDNILGASSSGGQRPVSLLPSREAPGDWTDDAAEHRQWTKNSALPSEKGLYTPDGPCPWLNQETSHIRFRIF